jgi:hypothetical protein
MANYINIATVLGITAGEVWAPTTDPTLYQCVDFPDAVIAKSTLDAFDDFFRAAVEFEYPDKLAGLQAKEVDGYTWTPAIGDYFSTYENDLDLWQILDDPGTDFTIVKLSGNLDIEANPQDVAQAGFTDSRFQVFIPEAASGSASSGSTSSGSASAS